VAAVNAVTVVSAVTVVPIVDVDTRSSEETP
jgi:hypothetical protein